MEADVPGVDLEGPPSESTLKNRRIQLRRPRTTRTRDTAVQALRRVLLVTITITVTLTMTAAPALAAQTDYAVYTHSVHAQSGYAEHPKYASVKIEMLDSSRPVRLWGELTRTTGAFTDLIASWDTMYLLAEMKKEFVYYPVYNSVGSNTWVSTTTRCKFGQDPGECTINGRPAVTESAGYARDAVFEVHYGGL